MTQKEHLILPVTLFSINYIKTHNARLKYEITYDLYKTAQKVKPKT